MITWYRNRGKKKETKAAKKKTEASDTKKNSQAQTILERKKTWGLWEKYEFKLRKKNKEKKKADQIEGNTQLGLHLDLRSNAGE